MIAEALARLRLGAPRGMRLVGAPSIERYGRITVGRNLFISSWPVQSHLISEVVGDLVIGDDVVIGFGAAIYSEKQVRIGDGTRLGPFCVIADTDFHVIGDSSRRPEPRAVFIGRGVRIGAKVNVLPGTTIGDGATVLPGSTVGGVVPAGAVVGGVPAIEKTGFVEEGGDLAQRIRTLVRDALGLASAPPDDQSRASISQWDSLATLRIALGVEELFSISLGESEVTRIRSVADLIAVVSAKV
jgi:acetyltransferase-like isoleucine patch superfamily enzyme